MNNSSESVKQAYNPYLPSYEYVPDGEPHVFGDRVYVFGSHDLFNGADFCLGDYVCWSAPVDELWNWRFEGTIYRKEQDPRNKKGKMHMCAPDVVQGKDGRYYLYYQLHALSITSVAVCDSPAGKYAFYGYVQHADGTPWGEKRKDAFVFDPGVLKDDDGTYYLYAGFSPTSANFRLIFKLRGNMVDHGVCLELSDDMITVVGKEGVTVPGNVEAAGTAFENHAFFEASSPRKIHGKYYLVYSSEQSHELCYAISDFPNKGFQYGGTIVSIGNIGYQGNEEADNYTGNTHGGLVEMRGQWYVFYHRQTNQQKCARQGCAEKISFDENGYIHQVETTSCGLNNGPLRGSGRYEARIACTLKAAEGTFAYENSKEKGKEEHPYFTQSGEDREDHPDQYIANMRAGATAGFRYFQFKDCRTVEVSVRGTGNGKFEVRTEMNGPVLAEIPISAESNYRRFQTEFEKPLNGIMGLYFTYKGSGCVDFDWLELNI